jgi:peptidoglycan-associated lipoprotein
MQKLSLLKCAALAVIVLSLVACSKKPVSTSETVLVPDASTAGAGYDEGFGEAGAGNVHTVCHPSIGNDHYYFDFDQDIIHEEDMAALKNQIDYLVAHNNVKVRVEGNTDERGSKEYNVALGHRRAKAVSRALSQSGIATNRIKVISYGEEKPISLGHEEGSWQCNRRVDLVYGDN